MAEQREVTQERIEASLDLLREGSSPEVLVSELVAAGVPTEAAETIVLEASSRLSSEQPNTAQEQQALQQQLLMTVAQAVAAGRSRNDIVDELVREGVPAEVAPVIVKQVISYKKWEVRKGGLKSLGLGLLILVVGGGITLVSYNAAESGGTYMVMTGAIVVGVWLILSGLWQILKG